jgi:hypothetical protein
MRGLRLRNAITTVFTIYSFTYLLHLSVVDHLQEENIYVGNYTTDNGSVVFGY